jgi:hypothetical protein
MSFTMEAFRSSLSSGVTDVLQEVTYISANALLAPSASGVQVSASLNKIHSFFGVSAHLENISPQAASFLPMPYPNLAPNNKGTAAESPARFWDWSRSPKVLRPTETLHMFASQTAAGAEQVALFVNFTDGVIVPAPAIATVPSLNGNGMFTTAHATATTTLTANAWTQVTPVFDSPTLPAGFYALVGARVMSAGALAFQMRPIDNPLWRPGGVGVQTADQLESPGQRFINNVNGQVSHWGVWLTFFQNVPPNVAIWSTSADTVEDMWFDVIKISDATTSMAL